MKVLSRPVDSSSRKSGKSSGVDPMAPEDRAEINGTRQIWLEKINDMRKLAIQRGYGTP